MEGGDGSNTLVENPSGSTSATADNHLFGMIQAQVEAIRNHSGRQEQLNGKRSCEDLFQNPSSTSATTGTTSVLGTEAKWEGNAPSFYYDEVNAQWVEDDEGRKAQVKWRCPCEDPVENHSATTDASGSNFSDRSYDDLVENSNGSASTSAGNSLFGMIKAQMGAALFYLSLLIGMIKAQMGAALFCLSLSIGMIKAQVGAVFNFLGRKAQGKRKRLCEDLGESSSATAAASVYFYLICTEAQVTEEEEEEEEEEPFTKNRHPYDVYPYPEIKYQYEGTRLVAKIRFPPSHNNYVRLAKRGPITPEEAAIKDPYYHHLVACGHKVKPMGKQWLARLS